MEVMVVLIVYPMVSITEPVTIRAFLGFFLVGNQRFVSFRGGRWRWVKAQPDWRLHSCVCAGRVPSSTDIWGWHEDRTAEHQETLW